MDNNHLRPDPLSQFELVIPIDPRTLGGFISDLLRRPQTIQRRYRGIFDIGRQEIINVFHLVNQRVLQQNRGNLVDFTVTVAYDDGSTVTVNSLEDFEAYAEIRPQVSKSAHLSWTYLLYFQENLLPEKQVIEFSITTSLSDIESLGRSESIADRLSDINRSGFQLRIQHSLRSWGVDIESLLTGHIQSWSLKEHWFKTLVSNHLFLTGFFSSLFLLFLLLFGIQQFATRLEAELIILAKNINSFSVAEKIDWLTQQTIKRTIDSRGNLIFVLIMGSLVSSALFGLLMSWIADNPQRSFLVLSEASKRQREKDLQKQRKGWLYFIATGITATIAGVASRFIFEAISKT